MRLNTYLNFDGNCKAAFEFYAKCLNSEIEMMMTGENTPESDCPADFKHKILHARMQVGGMTLMGSDCPEGSFERAQGFNVSVNVDSVDEADRIFNALSANGTVKMPIQQTFWSPRFGMLVDQFGTPWMVNCEPSPAS